MNLSCTGLSEANAIKVFSHLPESLFELNMSNNPMIGPKGAKYLAENVLDNKDHHSLEHLNLEGCAIGDEGCDHVCDFLRQGDESGHSGVRILHLSNNDLTHRAAKAISALIRDNRNLTMLFLHWNSLGSVGGAWIAKGVQENEYLQVLDLSFCALGAAAAPGRLALAATRQLQADLDKVPNKNGPPTPPDKHRPGVTPPGKALLRKILDGGGQQ